MPAARFGRQPWRVLSFWLPIDCVLCAQPPVQLCLGCRGSLALRPHPVNRPGLPPGLAATDFGGEVATLVRSFKESGSPVLATEMARALARPALASLPRADGPLRVVLIPAPSRPESNRKRGYQPARLLAGELALQLRSLRSSGLGGIRVAVATPLRLDSHTEDQRALAGSLRRSNLVGKMTVDIGAVRVEAADYAVLIDDVVTTGATLAEANRALAEAGIQVRSFWTFAETL